MKISKIIIFSLGIVAVSSFYLSCTKKLEHVASIDSDFTNSSTVQVYNAVSKSTRNYIYVDGVQISGSALAYGGIFPLTAYSFRINAGMRNFLIKDTLASSPQVPIIFNETFVAGKSYSMFIYDSLISVKHVTVLNNITVPTDTTARMRFANMIYNQTPVPAVDVYSAKKGATPIFTNVASGTVTDFVPYPSAINDTLSIYPTGTTTTLLVKFVVTGITPTRSYTTVYSGSYLGTRLVGTIPTY